jgi:putative transposase
MPSRLKRYQSAGDTHFITFSCFQRRPFLSTPTAKRVFEEALERVRRRYGLRVFGYVVMPEHIHLLVSEPDRADLATAIKSLKQGVARLLIADREHFWQPRYYDFNVHEARRFGDKLRYIHRNPVKRGIVERPEDWEWSSFRHWATGMEGRVEIESYWTGRKRERAGIFLTVKISEPHSSQNQA